MKPLETRRLTIRNWADHDRPLFHEINSDETVMEFFPFRRTRAQSDALLERLRSEIDRDGFGFAALERRDTDETIGFAGLHRDSVVPALPPGTVEIGWRLAARHWGRGYVTEAGKALLAFGFETLDLTRIVSFAVHDNHRSTAVMERLGMQRRQKLDFDHPHVPETHASLKRHVVYALERDAWKRQAGS